MKDLIDFTFREKYLINYYRDKKFSKNKFERVSQYGYLMAALVFGGVFFWNSEVPWLLVGYFLLAYRVGHQIWSGDRYSEDFSNIIEKYEAKLAELDPPKSPVI